MAANYRAVVLAAFKEAEDALSATKFADERAKTLLTAYIESQKAYDIARERYESGAVDFQTLLDAQRAVFSSQDNVLQARFDQISASVDLFKSLGGGWQEGN